MPIPFDNYVAIGTEVSTGSGRGAGEPVESCPIPTRAPSPPYEFDLGVIDGSFSEVAIVVSDGCGVVNADFSSIDPVSAVIIDLWSGSSVDAGFRFNIFYFDSAAKAGIFLPSATFLSVNPTGLTKADGFSASDMVTGPSSDGTNLVVITGASIEDTQGLNLGVSVAVDPVSLLFNGVDELIEQSTHAQLGFANQWSILLWLKPDAAEVTDVLETALRIDAQSLETNQIDIKIPYFSSTRRSIKMDCLDSSNVQLKDLVWTDEIPSNEWSQIVFTFDGEAVGAPMTLYIDGIDAGAPDVVNTDADGNMSDSNNRAIQFSSGTQYGGLIHRGGIWDSVLAPAEVAVINDPSIDLKFNSGAYVSSATYEHQYKLGTNPDNIGEDTGNGTLINLTVEQNIDASNIIRDAPE